MPKLKKKQNPNLRTIKIEYRVTAAELHEILRKAYSYVGGKNIRGKLSEWARTAALKYSPKEEELE